jgi:hypothetical protein
MKRIFYALLLTLPSVMNAQVGDTIKFNQVRNLIIVPVKINGVERDGIRMGKWEENNFKKIKKANASNENFGFFMRDNHNLSLPNPTPF